MLERDNFAHISEATREMLRAMLKPVVLGKDDGAYEIGQEAMKAEIKSNLEIYVKGAL